MFDSLKKFSSLDLSIYSGVCLLCACGEPLRSYFLVVRHSGPLVAVPRIAFFAVVLVAILLRLDHVTERQRLNQVLLILTLGLGAFVFVQSLLPSSACPVFPFWLPYMLEMGLYFGTIGNIALHTLFTRKDLLSRLAAGVLLYAEVFLYLGILFPTYRELLWIGAPLLLIYLRRSPKANKEVKV